MIVPVLDLMIGQVVLAQGGNRDAYRPVQSRLTTSSQPVEVAQAIFNQTGCDWLYIADIDSFAGAAPNWQAYQSLLDRGFGLWIDANWLVEDRYMEIRNRLGDAKRMKMIVSSETLASYEQFAIFEQLRSENVAAIFSLDQKGDRIISMQAEINQSSPLELIQRVCDHGVEEVIILDLGKVGTRNGFPDHSSAAELVAEIRSERPELVLTSGGGVRNADDVRRWIECGCNHVLVASAIHDCVITPDDCSRFSNPAQM